MKKSFDLWEDVKYACSLKIIKTMRNSLILVFLTVLQVFANESYSQNTRLSLDLQDVTIESVLNEIEARSEFFFLCNKRLVDINRKVSVHVGNQTINEILDQMFNGTDVEYLVMDRQVVLSPRQYLTEVKSMLQPKTVSGKVTDENGNPLPGLSVTIKGTTRGTVTDNDGNYIIEVEGPSDVLVFSYVGYLSAEQAVGDQNRINVTMEPDVLGLEEVVVIGYGTQKKSNLTGSVSDIRSNSIEDKPITKVSQLFAGQVTGVSAPQISGEPGADFAEILIRGRGTFSGAGVQPLVLVDGLPSSLENIDPNSIASISVLKDAASASIYGARAANGVILVTTKRGESGAMRVNYKAYAGWQRPAEFPDFVDSWEYATFYNEAAVNSGSQPLYSEAEIQKYRDGTDPYFANANHMEDLFTSGSGFQTNHNLSFTGGTGNSSYYASMAYLEQNGLVAENWYKRYNYTVNLNQKVSKRIDLDISVNGYSGKSNEPVLLAGVLANRTALNQSVRMLYQMANLLPPTIPTMYPDGSYSAEGGWINHQAAIDGESFHDEKQNYFAGSANLRWNIVDNLRISGKVGYIYDQGYNKTFNATFRWSETLVTQPAWLWDDIGNHNNLYMQSLLEYDKLVRDHYFYGMVGYVQEEDQVVSHSLARSTFPSNATIVMNAGSTETWRNGGNIAEWSLQSFIGRFQYSFRDKYLFEANARYDGSSRFAEANRFGFFPSFSGAWRLSEESFFEVPWVNDLKLRASWGELGNQNIGNYPYQKIIALGQDYPFGNALQPGATLTTLPNEEISWETTRITDLGIDIALFNRKLVLYADYFDKKTSDILFNIPASGVLGFTPSIQNAGAVTNRGFEFELIHKNRIGDFSYTISPNYSFVRTEVATLPNTDRIISLVASNYYTITTVGEPMGAFYGYLTDGLFADQADIDNSPDQPHTVAPGDIKYRDISGPDGVPDGRVDPEYDRTVLGSHYPKHTFGGLISLEYKNFDVVAVLQGVAGVKGILTRWRARPFDDGGTNVQRWQTDRWSPENPDPNARLPRYLLGWNAANNVSSDFWIIDASYLRIKNIQIGYTLPASVSNALRIDGLRIYFSANNLHTFDNYYEGYDPDMRLSPDQRLYPITSTYTFGIDLKF